MTDLLTIARGKITYTQKKKHIIYYVKMANKLQYIVGGRVIVYMS